MKNLFQKASSPWVRYSEYEYKKAEDGHFYITSAVGAKPEVYDPLKRLRSGRQLWGLSAAMGCWGF